VLLLVACDDDEAPAGDAQAGRVTVSLALLDDPARHAAMYAIEHAIVTSEAIDVIPTYLSQSNLDEALAARQYDVVEARLLAVPGAVEEGLGLTIVSAGLRDLGGTLLIARAEDELTPDDLRGKTLGVPSLEGAAGVMTRYLLQERYDLNVAPEGGDLTFLEAPSQSLSTLLRNGDVNAAVVQELTAYLAEDDADFAVLSEVSGEVADLTGETVLASVLVSYAEDAARKGDALRELSRLLGESLAYYKANRDSVMEAVAEEQDADPAFLRWWWERYDLPLGDLSSRTQEQIVQAWEAAKAIGDIESYPELADVLPAP
jgi:ABC-type nitrate/sulfonate/bicarbonate transport system substrate-binding protein